MPGEVIHDAAPDLFWSLSFALAAAGWRHSGGFDEEYVGYSAEDTDYAQRCLARGLHLGWVGDARAYHQYHPTQEPPAHHLEDLLRNGALFYRRWSRWPMSGWFEELEAQGLVVRQGAGWSRRSPGREHAVPLSDTG